MSEFKGTPGVWNFDPEMSEDDYYHIEIYSKDNSRVIGNVCDIDDAKLISAAPELLEALLRVRAQLDQAGVSPVAGSMNPVEDNYAFINQVIAKALGE